jgi:hypothetical protein
VYSFQGSLEFLLWGYNYIREKGAPGLKEVIIHSYLSLNSFIFCLMTERSNKNREWGSFNICSIPKFTSLGCLEPESEKHGEPRNQVPEEGFGNRGRLTTNFPIKYLIYLQILHYGFFKKILSIYTRSDQLYNKLHDFVSKTSHFVKIYVRKVNKSQFRSEEE